MEVQLSNLSLAPYGITASLTTAAIKVPVHGASVVAECTADSTFTCTVEGQFGSDGDWIQIPCTQSDGGSYASRAAGTTITLTDGDLLFIPCPGMYQVRIKRAGGTASIRLTASAASIDAFLSLISSSGLGTATTAVVGNAAHDAADSGSPVKVGAKAETALSGITLVADGDRTDLHAGVDGVLIVREDANLEDYVSGAASNTDGASTACIAAQASGIKTYLTGVVLCNSSAAAVLVEIKDGTTVKAYVYVPAGQTTGFIPKTPIAGTAATAWNFDPGAATTTVYCTMTGFKSKI
jgi:hypothetical protein